MKKFVSFFTKPLFLFSLVVLSLGLAGYSYSMYQESQQELLKVKNNPQAIVQGEAKALIAKVGTLVSLPAGENPTIATVTDKTKLKSQSFFAKAENGDKVIIYTQARKAYLYSSKLNKVLEVAPVNIGSNPAQPGQVAGDSTSKTPASNAAEATKTPEE